ncbi:alpha-ketoglutarate decarboxylase [Galbibacter pacificus]|uniref:Alpha-ketoglutarate decarboxylase n=1 Tax=Galbibacter pacificus TaxID=2996052 RepID=A0ABT6FTJ2_9FLAO|nr:alpha-ketoglutarate decarboxylase [Galbibacter pacificus]MDG3583112.1 alpha-ketoglutarate decarboxylase [Galbibacter pacificus]MDG3586593.1 alpha-ketoglutarate decarboxylase [Galbibacter pacificus]
MLGITHSASAQQMNQNYNQSDFWQRVRFGGGLGISFGDDFFSGSISPSAIYQVTPQFATGIGLDFTYTDAEYYNAFVYGASAIALFNPIREIQLSAEFEQLRVNRDYDVIGGGSITEDYWYPALFLGAGYNTGPVTMGVRYDVLYDDDKSIYASAFMPFVMFYF